MFFTNNSRPDTTRRVLSCLSATLAAVFSYPAHGDNQAGIESVESSKFVIAQAPHDYVCLSEPPQTQLNLLNVLCLAIRSSNKLKRVDGIAQEQYGNKLKSVGAYLPTITLGGNINRFGKSVHFDDFPRNNYSLDGRSSGLNISLNWLLHDFGLRKANLARTMHLIEAASLDREQVIRDTLIATADTYFKAEAARVLLREAVESERNASENAEIASALMSQGAGSISDKLLAQNASDQATLRRIDAESDLAVALADISTAIGQRRDFIPDIVERPSALSSVHVTWALPGWDIDYVQRSPRVRRMREEVLAARSHVAAARAQSMPTLAFVASSYRDATPPSQSTIAQTVRGWSLGLQLRIPLFDGFARRSGLATAQALLYQKQMELLEVEREVESAIWTSRQSLIQKAKKIEVADRISTNAQLAYRAAQARYKNGVGSMLELLKSQSDLSDARKMVATIYRDWEMAKLRFSLEIGRARDTDPFENRAL